MSHYAKISNSETTHSYNLEVPSCKAVILTLVGLSAFILGILGQCAVLKYASQASLSMIVIGSVVTILAIYFLSQGQTNVIYEIYDGVDTDGACQYVSVSHSEFEILIKKIPDGKYLQIREKKGVSFVDKDHMTAEGEKSIDGVITLSDLRKI